VSIVWKGENAEEAFIPVDLKSIERITISGNIPAGVVASLKAIIKKLVPKLEIIVSHSKFFENESWTEEIKKIPPLPKDKLK